MTIEVGGGAGGVGATYADLLAQATVLDGAGDDVRVWSDDVAELLLDPDVLEAVVLCPVEVVAVEIALVAAATGPNGLLPVSLGLEASALVLQGTVLSYEVIESTQQLVYEGLHAAGGFAVGLALPALGVAAGMAVLANPALALALGAAGYAGREEIGDAALQTLFENPWIQESVIAGAPWLVQGLATGLLGPELPFVLSGGKWPSTSYEDAIGGLVSAGSHFGFFRDEGEFAPTLVEAPDPDMGAPTSVQTIFDQQADLGQRANYGQVQITSVTHPDGSVSHIVQIPGTQVLDTARGDSTVDNVTNVNLMSGADTIMQQQVAQAMRDAGINPGEPVMLTGHSQGGIVCGAMASDPALMAEFNVTSVVTGGAPIARFDIPDGVSVLALEHEQDVIPMLDGRANPDRANWVTVERDATADAARKADSGPLNPLDTHGATVYADTGAQIDSSNDPSILAWEARNEHFFASTGTADGSTTTDVRRYDIEPVA